MACNKPIEGYRGLDGKLKLSNPENKLQPLTVPCGGCYGCREDRARDWAIRCYHESQMHKFNSVVTLTYAPEHLPEDGSLNHEDFALFMKRLRKNNPYKEKISYYMCGEYGEKLERPHYHAVLFGIDFYEDRYLWRNQKGVKYYRSPLLEKCWKLGNCELSDFSYKGAAYVARYISKKITGKQAEDHYGEKSPEYNQASLKPAIGKKWFERYRKEVFPADSIIVEGKQYPVPTYYDRLWMGICPTGLEIIKLDRKREADERITRKTSGMDIPESHQAVHLQKIARETVIRKRTNKRKMES